MGALPEDGNCWAETIEAVKTAPRTAVVNAEVVRRKPRLLAFLGPVWSAAIRANELTTSQSFHVPDPNSSHFLETCSLNH